MNQRQEKKEGQKESWEAPNRTGMFERGQNPLPHQKKCPRSVEGLRWRRLHSTRKGESTQKHDERKEEEIECLFCNWRRGKDLGPGKRGEGTRIKISQLPEASLRLQFNALTRPNTRNQDPESGRMRKKASRGPVMARILKRT